MENIRLHPAVAQERFERMCINPRFPQEAINFDEQV
jgi:hypothetical protein